MIPVIRAVLLMVEYVVFSSGFRVPGSWFKVQGSGKLRGIPLPGGRALKNDPVDHFSEEPACRGDLWWRGQGWVNGGRKASGSRFQVSGGYESF